MDEDEEESEEEEDSPKPKEKKQVSVWCILCRRAFGVVHTVVLGRDSRSWCTIFYYVFAYNTSTSSENHRSTLTA